ncbi:MAG: hypothetical protein U1E47_04660 [Rivihabitans pingtungensis]
MLDARRYARATVRCANANLASYNQPGLVNLSGSRRLAQPLIRHRASRKKQQQK